MVVLGLNSGYLYILAACPLKTHGSTPHRMLKPNGEKLEIIKKTLPIETKQGQTFLRNEVIYKEGWKERQTNYKQIYKQKDG